MLARRKRLALSNSSPKPVVSPNCQPLSKTALLNSPTAANCSTPTRSRKIAACLSNDSATPSKKPAKVTSKVDVDSPVAGAKSIKRLGSKVSSPSPSTFITPIRPRNGRNCFSDESPTMSPICVTWKWDSDSPARPTHAKLGGFHVSNNPSTSTCHTPIRHRMGRIDVVDDSPTASNKPNGIVEKQDCDSPGRPGSIKRARNNFASVNNRINKIKRTCSDDPSRNSPKGIHKFQEEMRIFEEDTAVTADLFNDSDFDQELLTCEANKKPDATESVVKTLFFHNDESIDGVLGSIVDRVRQGSQSNQMNGVTVQPRRSLIRHESTPASPAKARPPKKSLSSQCITVSESAIERFFLDNDESMDDVLGNIDDTLLTNLNSSKGLRVNAMRENRKPVSVQPRKALTPHKSMPMSSQVSDSAVRSFFMDNDDSTDKILGSVLDSGRTTNKTVQRKQLQTRKPLTPHKSMPMSSQVSDSAIKSFFLDNDESIDDVLGSIVDSVRYNPVPVQKNPVGQQQPRISHTPHKSMPVSSRPVVGQPKVPAIFGSQGSSVSESPGTNLFLDNDDTFDDILGGLDDSFLNNIISQQVQTQKL